MFLLFGMERRGKGVGEGAGSGGSMNIRLKTSLEVAASFNKAGR